MNKKWLKYKFNYVKDFTFGMKSQFIEVWGFDSRKEMYDTLNEHIRNSAPFDYDFIMPGKENGGMNFKYFNGEIYSEYEIRGDVK